MVQAGLRLQNRYKLVEPIGRGGFSEVWLAYDEQQKNSPVAVKILAGAGANQALLESFVGEYQIGQSIHDARVLSASEFFRVGALHCLIFPFMPGGSLYDRIAATESLPEADIARVLYQIAGALAVLHHRKPHPVLHLDVKPENILRNYSGHYLLSDLGVASAMKHTTLNVEEVRGKAAAYAAPEYYSDKGLTAATDVFALGVTLLECCRGLLDPQAKPLGLVLADENSLPDIPARYSGMLEQIIRSCLQPNPEKRPSASQLEAWAKYRLEEGVWPDMKILKTPITASKKIPPDRWWAIAATIGFIGLAGWQLRPQSAAETNTLQPAIPMETSQPTPDQPAPAVEVKQSPEKTPAPTETKPLPTIKKKDVEPEFEKKPPKKEPPQTQPGAKGIDDMIKVVPLKTDKTDN